MESQDQPFDDAATLERESFTVKTLSRSTAHYSGEFSHWNFSHTVRQKVNHYLDATGSSSQNGFQAPPVQNEGWDPASQKPKIVEYWRATQLQVPSSRVQNVLSILPPKGIAIFLAQVYFEFAQTNSFFVEDTWVYDKLKLLYEHPGNVTSSAAAWVCSVVMVLAVGTQFAHMGSGELAVRTPAADGDPPTGKESGTMLYQTATTLLPDIITVASLESVQACLLLAHYTMPLDTHGLAYTYLGLGIKMAIQNGMHRKYTGVELDPWTIETRNRLWWTAYTVERRVCVLHGRPASITAIEMDTELPKDLAEFRQRNQPSKFDNMLALIHLTGGLADIASSLTFLRRCPKALQATYLERILSVRERLLTWWSTLPQDVQTPSVSSPLFRPNVHLKLSYHLTQIFTGRLFIFHESSRGSLTDGASKDMPRRNRRATLVSDALEAAFDVMNLLELLHETKGLARESYTEFSSCRAALLLLLAQSINQRTERVRTAVKLGMRLIKLMSTGSNVSNQSEASVIETIDLAICRLHSLNGGLSGGECGLDEQERKVRYFRFKEWTELCISTGNVAIDPSPMSGGPLPDPSIRDLPFHGTSVKWPDTGDTMADLRNWTRHIFNDIETATSLDILPSGQMTESGVMSTLASQDCWRGYR
ncbi:putative PrnA-like fungal-specific transcription factor [Dactylonectria macrodidyma]|uniref:PrnA-like fungal-specific transcription factor n=1 Tax=Dactylonectria macrodidyma TaxID=307937 RepID=A0A9P9IE52_9HYPO|nr:putative PrnA-like fungal-specific transcription factor [Dactylonectria macrodidyma]